ncbi:isopentenyl-diphosphate Delta-isomerase [Nocardiopsis mangrovi]|uniref:Isopentenyl-diphosphate Delta-isomerase n=1 Tax=Nocardiopsis mangrovi TaxID=1179818 RepID=A0ABV9DYE2_9ACTN
MVVLLDETGRAVSSSPKSTVHTDRTPLHLAFSCYLFDDERRILMTRRAAHKLTWPHVWTNSCCGHPAPNEPVAEAVARRLDQELGTIGSAPEPVLPRFRYRAVMADGIVENELCPVFRAIADGPIKPDPSEVADMRWLPWRDVADGVLNGLYDVSPWCKEQVAELVLLGDDPLAWPTASPAEVPSSVL